MTPWLDRGLHAGSDRCMPKSPPAKVVELTERVRWGLDGLSRKMVPPQFALMDFVGDLWGAHVTAGPISLVEAKPA